MAEESSLAKKPLFTEKRIEVIVVILLGLTAVLNAWASWIGTLHGGNQATNYTRSNHLASQGSAAYSAGIQTYLGDLIAWNTLSDYFFDRQIAVQAGNSAEAAVIDEKIQFFKEQNGSEILSQAMKWMDENDAKSPFDMPGIADLYFSAGNKLLTDAQNTLDEGRSDNTKGDTYHLVNVLYSLVLFLLGIINIFKTRESKVTLLAISVVGLVLITLFMTSIPLPTGFDFSRFFA